MAFSRDKAIIIGVVVLGGLSFLVYRQAKHDQQLGTAATADVPDVKGTDDLDKIEITNGEKGTVTLQKEGDKWMVMPIHFPANETTVKQMLDNLKELKATEVVSSTADDDLKKTYDLDGAHALHFVGYKGADKKVDDWFGKSGGRGQMMMVGGKPQILAVKGYSSYLYSKDAKDWRDHDVFKFEDTNANTLTIENKNGKFSCTKGDKWGCTHNGQPIPDFDDSKPADAVRAMKFLVAEDFPPPDKTPADTGLAKPEGTITVALKDNAGTYTLHVGSISSGTSRYAMKEGSPTIYVVNPNVSEWAVANVDRFQKVKPDAGAPKTATASASAKKP